MSIFENYLLSTISDNYTFLKKKKKKNLFFNFDLIHTSKIFFKFWYHQHIFKFIYEESFKWKDTFKVADSL